MKPDFDLEAKLLQATSRQPPTDAEAAALRHAFVSLGQGLEQATSQYDVEGLVSSLRETSQPTIANKNRGTQKPGRATGLLWLAGLAAAFIAAVGTTWFVVNQVASIRGHLNQLATQSPVAPPQVPIEEVPPAEVATADPPIAPATQSDEALAESANILAWDDRLEETFTSIEQRVHSAASLASSSELRLETLNERIQSAAEDFDPTSL